MILRYMWFAIPLLGLASTLPTYTIQTVAGTDFTGDGGPATAAVLSQPEGIAVDNAGNIYIADADDNRVRKISLDGTIQTIAGTGHAGFSGDGGSGPAARLNRPYGLALDNAGDLYIADLGNSRVRLLTPAGLITTIAGGGTGVVSSTAGVMAAISAQLNAPRNVAVDPSGNLYISDFGLNQVFFVAPSGLISVFAGTGTTGFSGDGGSATLATLTAPAGIACDFAGNLYIADSNSGRVRQVVHGVIDTVFSIPSPVGVAISSGGTLYVAAYGYFGTIAQSLASGITARDVAVGSDGTLFVTGGSMVRAIAIDGSLSVVAGNGASRYYGGDGGAATLSRLHSPSGIALDDLGNAYIADTANQRIRKLLANGIMTTFAGTGDMGSGDGSGLAVMAQFNGPRSLALDSHRNLYVADSGNNRVCKITQTGAFTVVADQLNDPEAIAIDSSDRVYIADTGNDRVLQLTQDAASAVISEVLKPAGLTLDRAGNLFVSETNRISKISPDGTLATVIDGLDHPQGLVLTATGDLAVAESGTDRILLIQAGTAVPIAGFGTPGFSGDGGASVDAQLDSPSAVAIDGHGNLWITDTGNQRVRVLTLSTIPGSPQVLTPVTIVNAASEAGDSIAPGEIVSIFGSGFDPAQTQVLFAGKPATLFYTSANQINALVPALTPGASVRLTVVVNGRTISDTQVPVVAAVPGLFLSNQTSGQAAVINQDGTYNSTGTPALRGSYVSLYATGWTDPGLAVSVVIGGYQATVLYAGEAPGFPGLVQVNAQIPGGFLAPGTQSILLTVGTADSQANATIELQ